MNISSFTSDIREWRVGWDGLLHYSRRYTAASQLEALGNRGSCIDRIGSDYYLVDM